MIWLAFVDYDKWFKFSFNQQQIGFTFTMKKFFFAIDRYHNNDDYNLLDNLDFKLSDLFKIRGEVYKELGETSLMCEDFNEACGYGDCELYNMYCSKQ